MSSVHVLLPVAAVLAVSGCAVRNPQTYRLAPNVDSHVLVPPGIATADVPRGAITIQRPKGVPCTSSGEAIAVERHGGKLRLTVTRDALVKQPVGWLRRWTAELESSGCIPAGTGLELAARILESVPLDPYAAYRLMHADSVQQGFVELGPENRLQTQAPIMKSGNSPDANVIEIASITQSGNSLNVDLRASDQLLGVETAWYTLRPKEGGPGTRIVALSAERRIEGKTEAAAGPLRDYFPFAPEIGFYRLIYKADLVDKGATTEIVVGAPDRTELERRTRRVLDDFNVCKTSDPSLCAVIPRHVALNPALAVTVNGEEIRVGIRAWVRSAILQSGGPRRVEDVLPTLVVKKPYRGKLVDVEFDRASSAILDVTLLGGEAISYSTR
jgi:hypothetical protein